LKQRHESYNEKAKNDFSKYINITSSNNINKNKYTRKHDKHYKVIYKPTFNQLLHIKIIITSSIFLTLSALSGCQFDTFRKSLPLRFGLHFLFGTIFNYAFWLYFSRNGSRRRSRTLPTTFWRLCEGGASTTVHAGYKCSFPHCLFRGVTAPLAQNRPL
jgi:hypothetical protein